MVDQSTSNFSNMFNQQDQQQLSNGNNNAIAYHFNPSATRNVYDWYQTNTHVIINIMIKNLKEADVKVKLIDETLDVTCDLADGSIFKLHFNLFKPIYVQDSNWSVTPSKLEIQLKKTDRKRWQSLELIPEKSKQRNSHSNYSHPHHNYNHNNNHPQHQQQQQLQPPPQPQQQQQQLQTQIESCEVEQSQPLSQQQVEPDSRIKDESEIEVQLHPELQNQLESTDVDVESKCEMQDQDQDQTQSQSPLQSQLPSLEQQQNQQQLLPQATPQYSFISNKTSPEELEFLSNSIELSSSLVELDFVLSV